LKAVKRTIVEPTRADIAPAIERRADGLPSNDFYLVGFCVERVRQLLG
jgi:hypothetical protein